MKITPPTETHRSELSVVPLVNVVFLLLVFFMLVGQISAPEPLDIQPPRSISGKDDTAQTVKILLTRDGKIAVGSVVVSAAQLTDSVAQVLADQPGTTFQLKADARVDAVQMIGVMESLRDAGVEHLTLLTEQDRSR